MPYFALLIMYYHVKIAFYQQGLSAILNSVLESLSFQLDVKKTAKENWETIQILHVGVDHIVQSKIQLL